MKAACKLLILVLLITIASCRERTTADIDYVNIDEYWTLYRSSGEASGEKIYYLTIVKSAAPGAPFGTFQYITPVNFSSGDLSLGEKLQTQTLQHSLPDISFSWFSLTEEDGEITCTGQINGDVMSGQWTQKIISSGLTGTGTWRASKGLDDVENGSFKRNVDTGKTQIYFRAWADSASRVYVTSDFITGAVELVKCGKTTLNIDIWKISNTPDCSSEGYYEFPTPSGSLVVKTHIVKPSGEIVREKIITDGTEITGN